MNQKGFSLVELIVVGAIIAVSYTAVAFTVTDEPRGKARDDIRKSDINAIADAYTSKALDDNTYKPLVGRIPSPPEGGVYQGLLSQDSEEFKICAVLEKGKNINCLTQSDNPKCYCRSSHTDNGGGNSGYNNGGGNPSPSPSPIPLPSPSATACSNSVPVGLTTNYPGGSTSSIVGTDGTWCRDLNAGAGNDTMIVKSSCQDSCGTHDDYCQSSTTNRDWYCTGTWNGSGWKNVHCDAGGYVCNNGMSCSDGACQAPQNPFGQAISLDGKVAGKNPPSYTPIPEYVKANYDSKMNLPSNNVTVEAWIKPNVPTAAGYSYRIVDNTYRLTMDARPNLSNVSYLYYFDVQSSNNGCGQTVVYSGGGNGYDPNNLNWFNESHYMTVSPTDFNKWRHVAGVLHNGNLNLYENGIKLNSYNIGMNVCNDSRSMHVGAGLFGKNTPYYDYFQGLIDEVRISDIARYTGNFSVPKLPFSSDSNTDMLYHFDGNTNDSSSNGLNGVITGSVNFVQSDVPTN